MYVRDSSNYWAYSKTRLQWSQRFDQIGPNNLQNLSYDQYNVTVLQMFDTSVENTIWTSFASFICSFL